jgi:hypothetical protein
MTTLAQQPTDDYGLLSLIAEQAPAPFADRFRETCKAVADDNYGWINPNEVRRRMLAVADFSPREARQYSGIWCKAAGRNGYLDVHRDDLVDIDPEGSTRNGAKRVPMRSWRGWGESA